MGDWQSVRVGGADSHDKNNDFETIFLSKLALLLALAREK